MTIVQNTTPILLTFLLYATCTAFTTPDYTSSPSFHIHKQYCQRPLSSLSMAKKAGKGFGKPSDDTSAPTPSSTPPTPSSNTVQTNTVQTEQTDPTSGGAQALARLRRLEAEKRDAELRSIRDLQDLDTALQSEEQSAAIPEKVARRMGMRMLPFVGLPLFGGMGVFVGFWYFATYRDVEVMPNVVAACTIAVLVIGLLGITYSVMSASWDPETEGSTLGLSEFNTNINNIKDGLRRSRENELLREKMKRIPREELEGSVKRLEEKEKKMEERGLGLKEKLEKEME